MKRSPAKLSTGLHKSLEVYALAATVSGVGWLISTPMADAQIIYTPAKVRIAPNSSYAIDLNHDGIIDFTVNEKRCFCFYGGAANDLKVFPAPGAGVASSYSYSGFAGVLHSGAPIPNSLDPFVYRPVSMQRAYASSVYGGWDRQTHEYLGLIFRINGQIHYGWARMTVQYDWEKVVTDARLEGFAYESEAGKPIRAGDMGLAADAATEKPTLGMLAAGAAGLAAWRK